VADQWSYLELRDLEERLRRDAPLVADESIDCVISSCVLNLVRPEDKSRLFAEIFRVLKRGGRAVISDIVADEDVPADVRADPELWSGCIGGALREDAFLGAFEDAGFHGIHLVDRQASPWRTVRGIEFRSVTVVAFKGKQGPSLERKQALIYRGPFRKVEDDDGHLFPRGQRIAVCDKTFHLLRSAPYENQFIPVEPLEPVPLDQAPPFDCRRAARRDPRETKGAGHDVTTAAADDCTGPGGCC
jgi:SAM-dependent methyltransferase